MAVLPGIRNRNILPPKKAQGQLQAILGPLPVVDLVDNMLVIGLTDLIWHPCITYGCFRDFERGKSEYKSPPLFYEGVDDFTANLLESCSGEVIQVKNILEEKVCRF